MVWNWPLVGRAGETRRVLEVIAGRHRPGVVIAGGAGVGKTRLARSVMEDVRSRGHDVEWIAGTRALSGMTFGAVAQLLPADGASHRRTATVVERLAGIREAVTARSAKRPLVVFVDDAHCLDEASAAVIHQLVTNSPASVVATFRSGEATPEGVTALWKDELAEWLELQPLSDGELRILLESALCGPVDEPCVTELVNAGAGNCLYLRELVLAAHEDGTLAFDAGRWHLLRPLSAGPRLSELVEHRTGGLPEATRTVLELVAMGEPLPVSVLEHLADLAAIDDAGRRELITMSSSGRRIEVRLGHPIYGEVLRRRVPALRWRRHCRMLAEDIAAGPMRRREDVVRYVTWRLDAGLGVDIDPLLLAHERALEDGGLAAAERFADAARIEAATAAPADRLRVALAIADSSVRQLRFDRAVAALGSLDETALEPDGLASVVEAWANVLFLDGRPDEAEAQLLRVERRLGPTPEGARLRMVRAGLVNSLGRPFEALRLLDEAVAAVPGAGLETWELPVRAIALAFTGRYDDAEAVVGLGLCADVPTSGDIPLAIPWVGSVLLLVAHGRGWFDEAERLTEPLLDESLRAEHRPLRRAAASSAAWCRFQQGDVQRAVELGREGISERGGLDSDGVRTLAYAALAGALALGGELEEAEQTLARAATEDRPPVRWFDELLAVADALVAYRRGMPRRARSIMEAAIEAAATSGLRSELLCLAAVAPRVGAPDLTVKALEGLVGELQTSLPGVLLTHAGAVIDGDPTRLMAAAGELERCGMVLTAAEAAAEVSRLHDRAGRPADAAEAWRAARTLAARCPGADLAFLCRPGASTGASGLTPRELEIARMAAAGHPSARIAEELYLSVRTVNNHLGRVYLKLGISGRAGLAGAREVHGDGTLSATGGPGGGVVSH